MNKTLPILVAALCFSAQLSAQETQFTVHLSPADSLMQEGDVKGAIEAYRVQLAENSRDETANYNIACAFSMSGRPDSAFRYIDRLMEIGLTGNVQGMLTDPDLVSLHEDRRWAGVEDRLLTSGKTEPPKDLALAKRLLRMQARDQAYYSQLKIAEKKTGKMSSVVLAIWDLKTRINEENVKELEGIIAAGGWPKISRVGSRAANAAFLVVQHSDEARQKKYLPVIKELCEQKEAAWQSFALMYDRIQTSDNKPQRYGSQVRYNTDSGKYELFPLEDASKVDEWRAQAGLGPLSKYVARWGIEWKAP